MRRASCVPRTRLEVADVPVDVPEMRDTRQRYVHTIAGGPRDAQPLGALCRDRCPVGAPGCCPSPNQHLLACLPLLCRSTNPAGMVCNLSQVQIPAQQVSFSTLSMFTTSTASFSRILCVSS